MKISSFFKKYKFILLSSLALLALRIPSFFEPWWYGDENIYMAVGRSIANGEILYLDAWDNKPPLLYFVYALSSLFFENSIFPIRFFNALLGILQLTTFFYIAKNIFGIKEKIAKIATLVLLFFLATGLESSIFNAENLYVPLILLGFYLIFTQFKKFFSSQKINLSLFFSGFGFWSLAIFTKAQAFFEVFVIISVLFILSFYHLYKNNFNKSLFRKFLIYLVVGSLVLFLPYLATFVYYASIGAVSELTYSLVGFSSSYVSTNNDPVIFGVALTFISGLKLRLLSFVLLFLIATYLLFFKKLSTKVYILVVWLFATMFGSLISDRNYPHYLLQSLPIIILVFSFFFNYLPKIKNFYSKLSLFLVLVLVLNGYLNTFTKGTFYWNYFTPKHYFWNFATSLSDSESFKSWQREYNGWVYDSQEKIVPKIREYTSPNDRIYITGEQPDLYFLSQRLPGHRFVVNHHYTKDQIPSIYSTILENDTKLILLKTDSDEYQDFKKQVEKEYYYTGYFDMNFEFWIKK